MTAVAVFDQGAAARRRAVQAGEIGKLWGLAGGLPGGGGLPGLPGGMKPPGLPGMGGGLPGLGKKK